MIKVTCENGQVSMRVHGTLHELMADTIVIMRSVYEAIEEHDEESAKNFEFVMKKAFEDGVPFAASEELEKVCEESAKKAKADAKSDSDHEINEMLSDAVNEIKKLAKELKGMTSDE